jgi:hypothetical protein
MDNTPKPSWRDFWKVYPACAAFPRMTADRRRELADSINTLGLLGVIQTRYIAARDGGQNYVIDGEECLDAMEIDLGWQIVNERGDWHGALALVPGTTPKVVHRMGRTHEQVIEEVIALKALRQHLTPEELTASTETAMRLG